jgi:aminoglycoside phosphotransferase family enzyme/gluconate kinase
MSKLLIQSLLNPDAYDHETGNIQLLETHISWVILTGPFAYKIKKPVDFGFLDYSTAEKRRHFCKLEVSLNRRLAAPLYLGVVHITGSEEEPSVNGKGTAIEYAVKMKQFPSGQLLSDLIDNAELREVHIDWLARVVADFHLCTNVAPDESGFGSPDTVWQPVEENYRQIREVLKEPSLLQRLELIDTWSQQEFSAIRALLEQRKQHGFIRECHGDLHLGNVVLLDEEIVPFDCIEFNDNLRWIDVMSEVAFLVMDIEDHNRSDLAWRLLNAYLEKTGDYEGLSVFRFYLVYRAIVRAKVAALRLSQSGLDAGETVAVHHELENYLTLAERYIRTRHPAIILMHGLSGSGKTTVSQQIIEWLPAIRIRSDVERKRLHGLAPNDDSKSKLSGGIYDLASTDETYGRLAELAGTLCSAGYPVVVDATFLRYDQRQWFRDLADELNVPFRILDCHASHSILRERISEREALGQDASEAPVAVLERQLETHDSLSEQERSRTYTINTTDRTHLKPTIDYLKEMLGDHVDVFHD